MRVDAAAQVVVEEAVAAGGDRGRGDDPVGSPGHCEPGAGGGEEAVEVSGAEEVALGRLGAAHRLLVGLRKPARSAGEASGPGRSAARTRALGSCGSAGDRSSGSSAPAPGRRSGPRCAPRAPASGRLPEGVADEDRDQTRRRRSRSRRDRAVKRCGATCTEALGGRGPGVCDEAGVAVGRGRVSLGARPADVANDQGREQLLLPGLDPQGVGDPFRLEELGRAEELLGRGRGGAAVVEQLGPGAQSRSAAAARKSSGRTAQISRSKRSPPRSSWSSTFSTKCQPRLATVRFAASLKAGISP